MTYWACVTKLVAAKSNPGLSTPITATLNINIHLEKHFAHCAFWLDTSALWITFRTFTSLKAHLGHNNDCL